MHCNQTNVWLPKFFPFPHIAYDYGLQSFGDNFILECSFAKAAHTLRFRMLKCVFFNLTIFENSFRIQLVSLYVSNIEILTDQLNIDVSNFLTNWPTNLWRILIFCIYSWKNVPTFVRKTFGIHFLFGSEFWDFTGWSHSFAGYTEFPEIRQ